jgi:LPS-assembly lipoprotein
MLPSFNLRYDLPSISDAQLTERLGGREQGGLTIMAKSLPVGLMGMALVMAPTALPLSSLAQAPSGDSGCRPLHAPDANGVTGSDKLKDVDFAPIPGRVGQRIHNALIFESTGGGQAKTSAPQYRLEVVGLQEKLTSTLVNSQGRVSCATYVVLAPFQLIDAREKKVAFQGTSHARTTLERFDSPDAIARAREDAENRVARTIADDLKARLSAYLSRP